MEIVPEDDEDVVTEKLSMAKTVGGILLTGILILTTIGGIILGIDSRNDGRYVLRHEFNDFVTDVKDYHEYITRDLTRKWLQSEIRATEREKFELKNKAYHQKLTTYEEDRLVIVLHDLTALQEDLVKLNAGQKR